MLYSFCQLFLLFILYSIIGYIVEVICVSFIEKKIVFNRGYLIGPYIPVYGVGAMLMIFLLDKYKNDLIVLFIMGVIICTTLEYFTSLLMEKLFKLRWWDYSDKKFNINGRVCLENGVLFGLGGVIIIKIINPYFEMFISFIPKIITIIIGIILLLIFVADFVESTYITFRLKINVSKYINKDATREIKKEVFAALHKNTTLTNRLLNAFPHITHTASNRFNEFKKIIIKAKKEVKKMKTKKKKHK